MDNQQQSMFYETLEFQYVVSMFFANVHYLAIPNGILADTFPLISTSQCNGIIEAVRDSRVPANLSRLGS